MYNCIEGKRAEDHDCASPMFSVQGNGPKADVTVYQGFSSARFQMQRLYCSPFVYHAVGAQSWTGLIYYVQVSVVAIQRHICETYVKVAASDRKKQGFMIWTSLYQKKRIGYMFWRGGVLGVVFALVPAKRMTSFTMPQLCKGIPSPPQDLLTI